jgi:[ribosomal protein S5]-alanine N-acetyltransferase
MFILETERLKLIPLTHQLLQLWQQDRATMEGALGLTTSQMEIAPEYVTELLDALENFWLPKTAENADHFQWYTNWEIVLKADSLSIGGIGFVGAANEEGVVETGFMLDAKFQGKGYAQEALLAMVIWAFSDSQVKAVIARTYEDNQPTRRLLSKVGFEVHSNVDTLLTYRKEKG